jgi:hypothetical protein
MGTLPQEDGEIVIAQDMTYFNFTDHLETQGLGPTKGQDRWE